MGQTDSQFKTFLRFLLDDLKDLQVMELNNASLNEKLEKLNKVIDNLQKSLED